MASSYRPSAPRLRAVFFAGRELANAEHRDQPDDAHHGGASTDGAAEERRCPVHQLSREPQQRDAESEKRRDQDQATDRSLFFHGFLVRGCSRQTIFTPWGGSVPRRAGRTRAVGILDRERAIAPPLGREGVRDLDAPRPERVVVGLHVLDFDVDLDGPLAFRPRRPRHLLLRSREHDPDARPDHSEEVEPAILADHAHDVLEPQLLGVEAVDLVDRVHRDDRHHPKTRVLAHRTLPAPYNGVQRTRFARPGLSRPLVALLGVVVGGA
jgi:hypothetical protein